MGEVWAGSPTAGGPEAPAQDGSSGLSKTSLQTPKEHAYACLLGDSKSLQADSEGEEGIIGRFLAARLLPPNITPKSRRERWREKVVPGEGGWSSFMQSCKI